MIQPPLSLGPIDVKRNRNKPTGGSNQLDNIRAKLEPPPTVQDGPGELMTHISLHGQDLNPGRDRTLIVGELLLVSCAEFGK